MEATEAVRRMTPGRTGELSYLHWHGDVSTPPVVLLQPVNTAAAVWDQVAPLLGGRASYAIDYRGHGQSTATGPYLPSDYADDAIAMMDAAGIGVAHLVGGSIGGAVSVEMAMRCRGRIASISLFGAAVHLGYSTDIVDTMLAGIRAHGVEQWFAMHAHEIVGSASVDGVPARLAELAGGRPLETVAEIIVGTFQLADSRPAADQLRANTPPALVATGTEDPTCPPHMARELGEYLNTEAVLMDGIGHLPMIEAPTSTARMINKLLASIAG